MPLATEAAENALLIPHSVAWAEWTKALNIFVGRGKRHRVEAVQKGTGIGATMIYGWLSGQDHQDWRKPHMGCVLSMMAFLGPEFTSELARPASQGAYWLPDAEDTPPGDLAADLAEDTAKVTRLAADGSFKGDGKALAPIGRKMMIVGAQLQAQGAAA